MNVHDRDIVTPKVTTGAIAGSRKIYATPDTAPDLRVPVREIVLTVAAGEPPVPVYDPSGPYTDDKVAIDVEAGLKRTRIEWVRERGGVEEYEGRTVKPIDDGWLSLFSGVTSFLLDVCQNHVVVWPDTLNPVGLVLSAGGKSWPRANRRFGRTVGGR